MSASRSWYDFHHAYRNASRTASTVTVRISEAGFLPLSPEHTPAVPPSEENSGLQSDGNVSPCWQEGRVHTSNAPIVDPLPLPADERSEGAGQQRNCWGVVEAGEACSLAPSPRRACLGTSSRGVCSQTAAGVASRLGAVEVHRTKRSPGEVSATAHNCNP